MYPNLFILRIRNVITYKHFITQQSRKHFSRQKNIKITCFCDIQNECDISAYLTVIFEEIMTVF